MADEFGGIPVEQASPRTDQFGGVAVAEPETAPANVKQPILNMMGYSGKTDLDLPDEDKKHLVSAGILPNDDSNPFAAMNDFLVNQIWNEPPIPATGKVTFGQLARSALGDVLGALEAPFVLPRQAGEASEQFRVGEGTAAGAGTIAGAAMMGGVKLGRLPTPEARIAEAPREAPVIDNGVFRAAQDIVQARQLGVIGPERPEPTFKDSPSEIAERAVPRDLSSASTPSEERAKILGHEPGEYDARGKEWIDKIDGPDDVRDVIEKIANDHDFFPETRGGVASEASRAAVAEAAGVDPASIDAEQFSRTFDTDGKIRAVVQIFRQTTKDFSDAANKVTKEPTIENAAAQAEAEMRIGHVLEYTLGLRADIGRGLNVFKELLREQEHAKATVAIKADEATGKAPVGTTGVLDAAKDVRDNLADPKAKKLGLQKLIDQAQKLVDAEAEPKPGRPPLSPEIADLVGEARKVLKRFGAEAGDKTTLDKLIDQAEKQAIDMTKQKAVKEPTEALPPELQALLDKTKRVTDRFGGIAKGEKAALLLARTGRTVAEQEQLARSVSGLNPNQVAKILEKLRTSDLAKKPGWFYWTWQQWLLSGLFTHTTYLPVNLASIMVNRVIAPAMGATFGKILGQKASVAAPLYANVGMIHSVPDALIAAGEAFRTGNRVPLASEIRLFERGEESPQAKGAGFAYSTPGPDWGMWKRVFNETQLDKAASVLGVPGRSANMQHTFFKVLAERASRSTIAFEEAHAEGVSGDKFWQRYQYHLDNPTDEALRRSVTDAYDGAFMAKLGPKTEAMTNFFKSNPLLKWFFPFQHIPWNIERQSVELSPFAALTMLYPESKMGQALKGDLGAPAQNLAWAKMAIGTSIIGYAVHKLLAGEATADYPTDKEERDRWQELGIQPNSVQIGGYWVSYERLGPAGNVFHMGASIGSIIQHIDPKNKTWDENLSHAIWGASVASANQVGNEVGFQSLKNAMEAMNDEHKAQRFISLQAGSFLPLSSFNRQNAAFMDPYARKVDGIVSALKYEIPGARETLLPKRDPLYGEPVPNPAYHALKRTSPINIDPVKMELDRLKVWPGQPADHIHGVKLTPEIYAEYQVIAGGLVKQLLQATINNENWHTLSPFVQQRTIRAIVKAARYGDTNNPGANGIIMARHPEIMQQALQDAKDLINGEKPKKKLAPTLQ